MMLVQLASPRALNLHQKLGAIDSKRMLCRSKRDVYFGSGYVVVVHHTCLPSGSGTRLGYFLNVIVLQK